MKKINNKKIAAIVVAFALTLACAVIPASATNIYTINTIDNTPAATLDTIDNAVTIDDVHICPITKANENRHIVDCDECGLYERINHDDLEAAATNQFFHSYSCVCGYAYSENHNFDTTYTSTSHQEVCVDCGYAKEEEAHVMVNDFYGHYHDVQCESCGYMAEHHVGVKFETVDGISCSASCRQCGITEVVEHDFYDFECDNCNYCVNGDTYAIVDRIQMDENGDYRVRFLVNGIKHRITIQDVSEFDEGDFVKINHYGNEIFDICVIVDGDIIYDTENFINYLSADIAEKFKDLSFEDLIVEEIFVNSDHIVIHSESGRRALGVYGNYVVYDLCNIEMFDIQTDFAYVDFTVNDTVYLICFW